MERLKKILWSALTVSMRIGVLIWSALTVSMRIGVLIWSALTVSMQIGVLIWSALTVSMQIGVLVLGMVIGTERVEAVDLYVPSGYPTIQAAVNAANSGDRIYVSAGTYNEAVYINKRIALVGVGTPTITVKGLGETNTATFDGNATDNASIAGFKITGAIGNWPNGRGIYCDNGSPTINHNTISENNGYGIYCNYSSPTITNNTISKNGYYDSYYGIYCYYSSPTINHNTISGNGYGIWCKYSSPTINHNTILENINYGILCTSSSSPSITNNIISGNCHGIWCNYSSPSITNNIISGKGNGIFCYYYSSPTITNNTISGNSGNGICCDYSSSPTVTNNIITKNGTQSIYSYGIYKYSGNPTINYNCVWENGSPTTHNYYNCSAGPKDISANPQFIGGGDFHLQSSSPCIDSGSNTAPAIPSTDKDGNPRIINSIVDIGAYEYQGIAPPPSQLEITTNSLLNGQVNYIYSQVLSATGGTAPYSWSKISGSLPNGLTLSTSGIISGIPTQAGTFTFTIKATDSSPSPQSATKGLSMKIVGLAAIIVAGKGNDWREKFIINRSADQAYKIFRNLGFSDDNIFYLNANKEVGNEVDGTATTENFKGALTKWAPQRVGSSSPLVLYMVGHGMTNGFALNDSEFVPSSKLNEWLEKEPEETKVLIVIDACFSGSFIASEEVNSISSEGRVIVTSCRADEKVWVFFSVCKRFWKQIYKQKGSDLRLAFINACKYYPEKGEPQFDDNGDRNEDGESHSAEYLEQNPPESEGDEGWLAANMAIGKQGVSPEFGFESFIFAGLQSPGEIRVYDSGGRVTGLVDGNIKEEIPDSIYIEEEKTVIIWPATDTYHYEVVGTETGEYGLTVTSENEEIATFTATSIPTSANAIHQYSVDWSALSQGSAAVTIKIDANGDGLFEQGTTTGNTFTEEEFGSLPSPEVGTLAITSTPSGAEIYIDGVKMAQVTPATLTYILTGTHTVVASKEGYFPSTSTGVMVYADSEDVINFSLLFLPPIVQGITLNIGINIGTISTTITGSNFQYGATTTLTKISENDIIGTTTWESSGTLTVVFNLTEAEVGSWSVVVINPDGQAGTLTGGFTITNPIICITPNSGTIGSIVTVTGTNFLANSTITIGFGSKATITTTTSSNNGTFSCTFIASAQPLGTKTITATDTKGNLATTTFYLQMGSITSIKIVDSGDQEIGTKSLTTDGTLTLYLRGYDNDSNKTYTQGTWTILEGIGTANPVYGTSTIFNPTTIGIGTISATDGAHQDTTGAITVGIGSIASIKVVYPNDTEIDTMSLTTDGSQTLYLRGYDQDLNKVYVPGTWTVLSSIGTVSPIYGTYTIFNPTTIGIGTISATDSTHTDTTGTITVNMGQITSIRIVDSADQEIGTKSLTTDGTFAFHLRGYDDNLNKAYVPATWTVSSGIGTLSTAFGTSTIFYATSTGIGTITATDGTNTATITIIVGKQIDATNPYIGTLTTGWGTATVSIGTNTESIIILPQEPATGGLLQNLSGNIGIGVVVKAFGTSGNLFKGTLTNPVYIEIHYNESQLGNINEDTLKLYISQDNGGTWGTISNYSLNTLDNIIYGTFSHFSIIAPAGTGKQKASPDLTSVYAYPNPCKGYDKIIFANLTDQCWIRIYNIAGELIFEQEFTNTQGKENGT